MSIYETRSKGEPGAAGSPTWRHRRVTAELQPATYDWPHGRALAAHVRAHLGTAENVWHEIVSEFVHIDVHVHEPSESLPMRVLMTEGMSRRPMTVPQELPHMRWAELAMCLPPHWPLTQSDVGDERNYWPLRWLYKLARMPHEYRTWLSYGHTIPNGDPPRPFADNTELCCWLLTPPVPFGAGFGRVALENGEPLHIYAAIPIHRQEVDFKRKYGADALMRRLWDARALGALDISRRPVC
jgi:hypothetical protein